MPRVRPPVTGNQAQDRFNREVAAALDDIASAAASDVGVTILSEIGAGSTSATTSAALHRDYSGGAWLAIGAYTSACEIVRLISVAGQTVTFTATTGRHEVGSLVVVLASTEVTPQLFGWVDGGADARSAIQAAIDATANVRVPAGTYPISSPGLSTTGGTSFRLTGEGGSVYAYDATVLGALNRTTLKPVAGATVTSLLTIGATSGDSAGNAGVSIENVLINGTGATVTNGILFNRAMSSVVRNVAVTNCINGINIDGDALGGGGGTIDDIRFDTCFTKSNTYGLKLHVTTIVGALTGISMVNCESRADGTGVYILGDGATATTFSLENCLIQNTGGVGVHVEKSVTVSMNDCYVETPSGTTVAVSNESTLSLNSCLAMDPTCDSTSNIIVNGSFVNYSGLSIGRSVLGRPYDTRSGITDTWGPPNRNDANTVSLIGTSWTDPQGVEWVAKVAGSGYTARFAPKLGRVLIPIAMTSVVNGDAVWWPNVDMVLTAVTVVTTATLVANTATLFYGTSGAQPIAGNDEFFRIGAGGDVTIASMVYNAGGSKLVGTCTAAQNVATGLISGGKTYFLPGNAQPTLHSISAGPNPRQGDGLFLITDGTWTSGSVLIIIDGVYL